LTGTEQQICTFNKNICIRYERPVRNHAGHICRVCRSQCPPVVCSWTCKLHKTMMIFSKLN